VEQQRRASDRVAPGAWTERSGTQGDRHVRPGRWRPGFRCAPPGYACRYRITCGDQPDRRSALPRPTSGEHVEPALEPLHRDRRHGLEPLGEERDPELLEEPAQLLEVRRC